MQTTVNHHKYVGKNTSKHRPPGFHQALTHPSVWKADCGVAALAVPRYWWPLHPPALERGDSTRAVDIVSRSYDAPCWPKNKFTPFMAQEHTHLIFNNLQDGSERKSIETWSLLNISSSINSLVISNAIKKQSMLHLSIVLSQVRRHTELNALYFYPSQPYFHSCQKLTMVQPWLKSVVVAEYTLGRWERQRWDLVVDTITVSFQKWAEVRESAFF